MSILIFSFCFLYFLIFYSDPEMFYSKILCYSRKIIGKRDNDKLDGKFHFQDENFPCKYFVKHSCEETFIKYSDNLENPHKKELASKYFLNLN